MSSKSGDVLLVVWGCLDIAWLAWDEISKLVAANDTHINDNVEDNRREYCTPLDPDHAGPFIEKVYPASDPVSKIVLKCKEGEWWAIILTGRGTLWRLQCNLLRFPRRIYEYTCEASSMKGA